MKRTPMPRNFLWSERLRSSDQTTSAVQGMSRPLAFRTNGISALELNCLDKRMNAPLRLRFSVVPSTVPVGALIETGHSTLALVCRRLSVSIAACEIMCRRYFLVLLQKVLLCFQITGMRGEDATKKAPTDHHRKPIWLTVGSLWEPWPWRDEDKEYFFFPATLM